MTELLKAMHAAPTGSRSKMAVYDRVVRSVRKKKRKPIKIGAAILARVVWLIRVLKTGNHHQQHQYLSDTLKKALHEYLVLRDDKSPPRLSQQHFPSEPGCEDVVVSPDDDTRSGKKPRRTVTEPVVTVFPTRDEQFVRLLTNQKRSSALRSAIWKDVVAALGGAHPMISTSRCAIKRFAWLKTVASDQWHPQHSRLSQSLHKMLREYSSQDMGQRPTRTQTATINPPAKRTPSERHPTAPYHQSSAASIKTASSGKDEPRDRHKNQSNLLEKLERERQEHREDMWRLVATLQAIEKASERQHAQLLGIVELARLAVARGT